MAPPSQADWYDRLQQGMRRIEAAQAQSDAHREAQVQAWMRTEGAGLVPGSRDHRRALRRARKYSRTAWSARGSGVFMLFLATAAQLNHDGGSYGPLVLAGVGVSMLIGSFGRGAGRGDHSEDAPPVLEERRSSTRPMDAAPPALVADPRIARVNALCDALQTEMKQAPKVLQDVVHNPVSTVESLRQACLALVARETSLRAMLTSEDDARLLRERGALETRLQAEPDSVVRERLTAALSLLDAQRTQREELRTAAARLEAEFTRLVYTLENLRTQVLRIRTADAGSVNVAGQGLRESLERLGSEMDAVAESLEYVSRAPEGMAPVDPGPQDDGLLPPRSRQRD